MLLALENNVNFGLGTGDWYVQVKWNMGWEWGEGTPSKLSILLGYKTCCEVLLDLLDRQSVHTKSFQNKPAGPSLLSCQLGWIAGNTFISRNKREWF